ncbi:CHASE domain-containing protein [Deinococcus altitudinis]|uniref:CHASE domain-containing protein n=1 Tax=Deinococcus altitudinis TaxID=468914 RepID=UPI003891471F
MKVFVRRLTGLLPAPLWVLMLVLSLTVVATATVRELAKQQQLARFDREITAYQRELRQRFEGYAGVLVGVRASWEAVAVAPTSAGWVQPALSSQQFGRLVSGLNLAARFPGLNSLGYAPLLPASGRAAYARQLPLVAGDPDAELHPSSRLALAAPVTYLVPAAPNSGLLGFDMYTDQARRVAIDQAIGSGVVTATRQVELLHLPLNEADRGGLILYLPLRREGRVTGLLYAPLRLSAVLPTSVAASAQDRLSTKILVDGQGLGLEGSGLQNSGPQSGGQSATGTPQRPASGLDNSAGGFQQTETLVLAGQTWTLAFSAPSGFGRDAAASVPWLVLLVGTLVALLAAAATQAQVRARVRAERVSHSLSLSQSRLERSRAEFEAVFRAMQDTAVFTDLSGRVLFANDALQESFGLNPFELRGAPLADLHADTRLLPRLDALPGPHLVTTQFRRKDRRIRSGGPAQNDQAVNDQAQDDQPQARQELFYGEMQRNQVKGESGEILGHLEIIRDVSERLEADRALRAGERRYQGVLEGMPQIVFLTDAAGRVSYLNRRWWEYVGGTERPDQNPDAAAAAESAPAGTGSAALRAGPSPAQSAQPDWTGRMLKAVHPDDRAEFQRRWQDSLRDGRELELEHRLRSGTGQYRTFVTRVRPVFARGKVQEWVGSSTDIDDQIYAEGHSRLLADVGQALNDRTHGEAGRYGAGGVTGGHEHRRDAQLQDDATLHADTQPHDDAQPHDRRPDAAEAGGSSGSRSAETLWQTDAGLRAALSLMTARFADSAVFWPGPDVHGAEGEVTGPLSSGQSSGFGEAVPLIAGRARRIGLEELGEIEQLSETVTELMYRHEPAVFHGERLHSLGLSSAVLYPLSQGDVPLGVLGLGFRHPLQDRDLELARELAQRLTTALDNRNLLLRLQLARESLQELNETLEHRVAERTVQLSEANSELEAFSYSVSHDLRTPLRHILGFADLLKRETELSGQPRSEQPTAEQAAAPGTGPKAVRYLNIIVDSAGRMSRLIDDLLEFSRTSRAELRRSTVDLARLVQDGRQGLAPDQGERRVEWNVGPLPVVIGDPGLLRQVIDNLLSNALKYTRTRDPAVIEIRSQPHDREVWLSIRDNGVGFDPEYVGKLFGVFQRLHRNEEFEGTGIGLANVRRIVARHGGRVWAESGQDGQPGATFWVALPLEPLSLQKADRKTQQPGDLQPQIRQDRAGSERSGTEPSSQQAEVRP